MATKPATRTFQTVIHEVDATKWHVFTLDEVEHQSLES
jgi:hypothetical protein